MSEPAPYYGERRFPRFPVNVPVVAQASQFPDRKLHGRIRNIGRGGLLAEFALQLVPGSRLEFSVVTSQGLHPETGRVVWASASGDVVRHGIAFLEPKGPSFGPELLFGDSLSPQGDLAPEGTL